MVSRRFCRSIGVRRDRLIALAVMGQIVWAAGGCSELASGGIGGERGESWSRVTLPKVSRAEAFDAGVYAMRQWFRLESVAPESGSVQSVMSEYEQKGGTGRIRDAALGYRNRMRRQATLVVEESSAGSVARCIVKVERLDTADHRVFRDQTRFEDYPTETPIDREAGVSARQDEAWTEMPRDRGLEREILAVLKNRATPTSVNIQP